MAKLCKSRRTVNSKVNPKSWYYGLEHCRELQFSAIPAGEQSIELNLIQEDYTELLGYIHITNGGADPAPVGRTKLATVDVTAMVEVSEVLAEIKAQLDLSAQAILMQTQVSLSGVEIRNNFIGLITAEDDSANAEMTNVVGQQSFGGALGLLTEDGASASFEFEYLDQTSDITGNALVERFLLNVLATVTLSITDTSKEKFEEVFIKPLGGDYENAGERLIGFGTGNFFKSLMTQIGKLVGHDANTPFSDRSNDWQMLAAPTPSSINFNKELQAIECEFVSVYDATMPEDVNIFSIGDMSIVDYASL
jgi:hypothetical protein